MEYTDLNQEKNYPEWACRDCLSKAGGKRCVDVITPRSCVCDVCGRHTVAYAPIEFGYPLFKKPKRSALAIEVQ